MGTYNFNGTISGPGNYGDNGKIEVHHHGSSPAEALRLAADLVQLLRAEGQVVLAGQAETVRGELVRAEEEQRPADRGRIRQALETVSMGLAAGSGGLALAQQLAAAVGL